MVAVRKSKGSRPLGRQRRQTEYRAQLTTAAKIQRSPAFNARSARAAGSPAVTMAPTPARDKRTPVACPHRTACPNNRNDNIRMRTGVVETSNTALVAVVVCNPR